MPFSLGAKSKAELAAVHPKLVKVVERAIQITTQDFTVHDGLRTKAEQEDNMRRGASKTMDSKHLKQADGFSHAVDLVPYIGGQLKWDWPAIYHIAAAVRQAADEQNVELVWGGVWDRKLATLGTTADDFKAANAAYVARRKAAFPHKSVFIDGPHYQLA